MLALGFWAHCWSEAKTDYCALNGDKYLILDMSEDLPEGYDILREELSMVINNPGKYEIISVEPILCWRPEVSKAIDSRIWAGDELNSEGKKFYNGQLMYGRRDRNIVDYILVGYTVFGGIRTTTMYHLAFMEIK